MIKHILIVVLCTMLCACNGKKQLATDSQIDCYKNFLCEATAFDYCGSSYSTNDVAIAARTFTKNDVLVFFLSENGQEKRSIEFFMLLKDLEKSVEVDRKTVDTNSVAKVKHALLCQKRAVVSRKEKFSLFCYERNLIRLLYSVDRMVGTLQCSAASKLNFLSNILSDDLFTVDLSDCDWIVGSDNWAVRLQTFRNLLQLSCHLSYSSECGNWQIQGLGDDHLKTIVDSGNLCVCGDENGWHLILINRHNMNSKSHLVNRFFCPQIIEQKVGFLSSDYSERRTNIFRHGEKTNQKSVRVNRGKIIVEQESRR